MALRRLPVLQDAGGDPPRPSWQWVLIGGGLAITVWLPLAVVALWAGPRLALLVRGTPLAASVVAAAPSVLSFALANAVAGGLITHFGTRMRRRHALGAGLLAALTAWLIALLGGALRPWPVAALSLAVLAALGGLASLAGAWLVRAKARRRVKRADPANRKM
jgi:hypothetical protein